ncbi:MAG: hypothetical protein KDH17_06400 [Rhodocyclaceae bacterium]|nr:hypothetical protein [Rhodocyclaceae bacterium]
MTKHESHSQDDHWLAVLAGRAEADDDDTRQAAVLRGMYLKRAEAEFEAECDSARQQRLLARLAQHDPSARPASNARRDSSELPVLGALWRWLAAPVSSPSRLALVATVVLAVLAVPLLRHLGDQESGEHTYKGGPVGTPEFSMMSDNPIREAEAIVQSLAAHGVRAEIIEIGNERLVRAQIPESVRAAARADLADLGIVAPADGRVAIRIRPTE